MDTGLENRAKVDSKSNNGNPNSNTNAHNITVSQSPSSECSKPDEQSSETCAKKLELSPPAKIEGSSETETNVTTPLESNKNVESSHTPTTKRTLKPSTAIVSGEPRIDQNGSVSPPVSLSEPTSPKQTSTSVKKALLLAKKYEQGMASRAALIYKEGTISSSSSAITKRRGTEGELIVRDATGLGGKVSQDVSLSDGGKSPDKAKTSEIGKLNDLPPITESVSTKFTKTILSSLQRDTILKERLDNINNFLSDSIATKPVTISPPLASNTCVKNSLPSHSGSEYSTLNHHSLNIATPGRLQVSTRFQKLMKLRSQSPKLVRLISGPQFTFNVS